MLENQITRAEVLNRTELMRVLSAVSDAISSRVMSCAELSRSAKEDVLRDLSTLPVVLQDVAARQSRFARGNGPRPESEGEER
jgi:hypothetical protein